MCLALSLSFCLCLHLCLNLYSSLSLSLRPRYGIQGFPTIKVFGANKKSPTEFNGARKASAMVSAAFKEARDVVKKRLSGKAKPTGKRSKSGGKATKPKARRAAAVEPGSGSAVVTLTESNFDDLVLNSDVPWMVEFYAPWCGHCKTAAPEVRLVWRLLPQHTQPRVSFLCLLCVRLSVCRSACLSVDVCIFVFLIQFAKAAEDSDGSAKFGAVNGDEQHALLSRFGVDGFPMFKTFPAGSTSDAAAQNYDGPRNAGGFAAGIEIAGQAQEAPEVPQLVSQDVFKDVCEGDRICLIAFVPNILDDGVEGRNNRIDILSGLLVGQITYSATWTVVGDQPELDNSFGALDFPTVVALRANKKAFVVHRGPFTTAGLENFCRKVAQGKGGIAKLDELPTISTVEAWDGEAGKLVADDEEFSLDDIMKEEL